MAELVAKQDRLQRSIERAVVNFKKIGKNNLTAATIRSRIEALKEVWRQYQEGDLHLAEIIPAETKAGMDYFKAERFEATEETYQNTLDYMANYLEHVQPSVSQSTSTFKAAAPPTEPHLSLAQLPPIRLPPFDGNIDEWESFRDRFNGLILKNPEINGFARMHYLVSTLKGRALDCIANIPVTADNFEIAWSALQKRFENKRRLLTSHLSVLLELSPLPRESASDLQALRDRVNITVASLQNLGRSAADLWNDTLVHIISQKLDTSTRKAWTIHTNESDAWPTFVSLQQFVDARVRALEEFASAAPSKPAVKPIATTRVQVATVSQDAPNMCPLCQARHYLASCPAFLAKSARQRNEIVKRQSRCFNCLSQSHAVSECSSQYSCRVCQKRHHSLLHDDSATQSTGRTTTEENITNNSRTACKSNINTHLVSTKTCTPSPVLLATAWVRISVSSGRSIVTRALVDQGSEASFISEALAQALHAKRRQISATISAVGGVHAGTVRHVTTICVSPRESPSPAITTAALVLKSLSTYAPKRVFNAGTLNHLADLPWADSDPTSQHPIQVILGADVYHEIILGGVRKGGRGLPIAQQSVFGWLISGPMSSVQSEHKVVVHHCTQEESLEQALRQFWEHEELPSRTVPLSPEEERCETHFRENTSRTADGRYLVRLPFRSDPPLDIGFSRPTAEKMLGALSRKFRAQPTLAQEYEKFLSEYEDLGHMQRISEAPRSGEQRVYIPHHPVVREGSATTHLRVVFNASSVTSNGSSLNDHLLPGPKLQTDLPAIINRWRKFKFVYIADIAKMYRQIRVHHQDTNYQVILWKDPTVQKTIEYRLLTVTYGMNCAPYLALRVMKQLTIDEGSDVPIACSILRENTYVDDVLFGGDEIASLRRSRDQLNTLLARGQFLLRKWASNSESLLADIDPADHGLACSQKIEPDDKLKVLGIEWNPSHDTFQFKVALSLSLPKTKRTILSTIAKLYDPLGWVTPAVISAKIFLQQLWRLNIDWDQPIPEPSLSKWSSIHSRLQHLSELSINRWTGFQTNNPSVELHGFADASTVAYAAVVYIKVVNPTGEARISLLAAKSKVAPLTPLTVPRLELSAAVLLARLIEFVRPTLAPAKIHCFCWTDSSVVLAWLQHHPSRWRTFVANRVATIQQLVPEAEWRHVATEENPADCASRGLLGNELRDSTLWWRGPSWLPLPMQRWPTSTPSVPEESSLEKKIVAHHTAMQSDSWELESRFSSWPKLLRVTAYVLRFVQLCRSHVRSQDSKNPGLTLTVEEYQVAKLFWIKKIQHATFPAELHALENRKSLHPRSSIISLNPFLDSDGILRVGGRLSNAPIPLESKHPILLGSHPLVRRIIENTHTKTLHGGIQLTLTTLRQEYWIVRARSLVRSVIHKCVKCVRERASHPEQLMGNLPAPRVTQPSKCFAHCGLDYAGPVKVRPSAGRGRASQKAYIALFVCLATKAIHLELVGDYSTAAFLNAFTRFCSRRGLPEAIYSDNGTTFVGADKELAAAHQSTLRDANFINKTVSDGISWHFIPPSAPHFGGLWEAGVRSMKHHLRRILGDCTLTFEEFTTLLCSIEACLNSRPIAPLSDAFDNHEPLTPGHFLTGAPLSTPPQPSLLHLEENRLSRWQLIRHKAERFWKLWQNDYVNTLQQRVKWRSAQPAIKIGQLVLLHNANLPPCKWELARVIQTHPGDDGMIRVVTVKTANSEFKRPIVKLCPLPVEIETATN